MKKIIMVFSIMLMFLISSCSNIKNNNTNSTKNVIIPSTNNKSISTTTTEEDIDISVEDIKLEEYIDTLKEKTYTYIPSWNKEGYKGKWNYIDGVFLKSMVDLYHKTNNEDYISFVKRYVDYYIASDGTFINLKSSSQPGFTQGELDSVCESNILFDLYEKYQDEKYLTAIEFTYNALMDMPKAQGSNNFWHKTSYVNQIWLDGMYMYGPFLARYAKFKNDDSLIDLLKEQYQYIEEHMKDLKTGLYYHANDTTKSAAWANSETGNSPSFWLRSMGWFIISLVDVIDILDDSSNRDYLINLFNETIDSLLKFQDEKTKMFYQIIDKPDLAPIVSYEKYLKPLGNTKYTEDTIIKNYLESSGSFMVAYSLIKGSNIGILDDSYYDIGIDTFVGTYKRSFKNNSLNNICITAGLGPNYRPERDGSYEYYLAEPVGSNDAKGVGPFIMAYINI